MKLALFDDNRLGAVVVQPPGDTIVDRHWCAAVGS